MNKRLLILAVGALTFAALAGPAQSALASGAFTQTQHITTLNQAIPLTCAGPNMGVTIINATGNGVEHLTFNGNGGWFTTTFTGDGTITMLPPGTTYQGHVQLWFASEDNKQSNVFHATFNFHGVSVADPSQTLDVHGNTDVTVNPDGTVTADHFDVNCH